MRRLVLWFGVVTAAAVSAGTAVALEEQRGPAPAIASPDAPKAQTQEESAPARSETGTEIRIPGLGKLGTLPKMDFGLELLYGADEGKPTQPSEPQSNDQEDLMIHGSVKHRF